MNISFSSNKTTEVKEMKPWQGVLFGIVFAIVGVFLIFFSIKTIKEYKEKDKTYVETTAVVVDYDMNSDGLEAIIVEYTVNGSTYKKTSNTYSNNPKDLGSSVSVKYNPNNPQDAIWTNDSTNIVLPIAGVVFTGVGILLVVTSIKKGKNQKLVGVDETLNSTVVSQPSVPEVAPEAAVNNVVNTPEAEVSEVNNVVNTPEAVVPEVNNVVEQNTIDPNNQNNGLNL